MILTEKDIAIARSDNDLRETPWSIRWEDNMAWLAGEFDRMGYTFYIKGRAEPARNRSTTLPFVKQVRFARKYESIESRQTPSFTATTAHERVHAAQPVSVIRYASARYRFRVELPAFRETMRIRAVQEGMGRTARQKLAHHIAGRLRTKYLVGLVDKRAHQVVTDILLEEARR